LTFKKIEHYKILTNTISGFNSTKSLPIEFKKQKFKNIGIILDENVSQLPVVNDRINYWKKNGLNIKKIYLTRSGMEPDYGYLDQVVNNFRNIEFDVIVGIGGGSTLDISKGVGLLLKNSGAGIKYRGMDLVQIPGVPVVLIPTTAGTGSEVTKTASFIDLKSKTKLGINGKNVECFLSFLDPALIINCPPSVTISAGLDALVHAVEAITASGANYIAKLFGIEAVQLMFDGFKDYITDPKNIVGREKTLLGSHFAGIAMWNSQGGPASGISYPLGVHFGVPHGFAGGVLLPHVVSMNIEKGYYEGYDEILNKINPSLSTNNKESNAILFKKELFELYNKLNVPNSFSKWGIKKNSIDLLVEKSMEERKEVIDKNPIQFCTDDINQLIQYVLKH